MRLKDRVAIVTGAGTGIGRAVSLAFAGEGAAVVLTGRRPDPLEAVRKEITGTGGQATIQTGDVSDPQASDEAVAAAVSQYGRLDILVNNAGMVSQETIAKMTDDQWNKMLNVDLFGCFAGCRAAARQMISQGNGGRIINCSSIMAWQPRELQGAYAAAKAGMLGMSRSLAIELGPHAITVNCVLPGHIKTEMTEEMFTPEVTRAFEDRIPLGQLGEAGWVAGAFTFLASDEARYITGVSLLVDGGFMINGNLPGVDFGPSGSES
jgi:3-oxoacyl-[acyl-carrier protein] reductase